MGASLYDLPHVGLDVRQVTTFGRPVRPDRPQVWLHGRRGPAIFPPGRPVFFTTDRDAAAWYAGRWAHPRAEPRVHAALVDIRAPAGYYDLLRAIRRARASAADIARHSAYDGRQEIDYLFVPKVRTMLGRAGYDGYLGWDAPAGRELPVAVVFHPEQIVLLEQQGASSPIAA